jgi:hypothetical protein
LGQAAINSSPFIVATDKARRMDANGRRVIVDACALARNKKRNREEEEFTLNIEKNDCRKFSASLSTK